MIRAYIWYGVAVVVIGFLAGFIFGVVNAVGHTIIKIRPPATGQMEAGNVPGLLSFYVPMK